MYEIEHRAIVPKDKLESLKEFLSREAKCLGEDNKDAYYFIFPDKLLKLVHNTSKHNARMSLKLNRIGQGSDFEEIEFNFQEEDFPTALKLVQNLGLPVKVMSGPQIRTNYEYLGCEIALKWSDVWQYHLEIEKMIRDKSEQAAAEAEIQKVADELGVKLMTQEELQEFTTQAEKGL